MKRWLPSLASFAFEDLGIGVEDHESCRCHCQQHRRLLMSWRPCSRCPSHSRSILAYSDQYYRIELVDTGQPRHPKQAPPRKKQNVLIKRVSFVINLAPFRYKQLSVLYSVMMQI